MSPNVSTGDQNEKLCVAAEHAESLLMRSDILNQVVEDVHELGIAGEDDNIKLAFLVGVSRLASPGKTLGMILKGKSSSGKSVLLETVAELFPPLESLIEATDITPNALYYSDDIDLKNKVVLCGERSHGSGPEHANATRAFREMLSRGHVTKLVTVNDSSGVRTEHVRANGPISFLQSTTAEVFPEDENRCLVATIDESHEQTRRILLRQASSYSGQRGGDSMRIKDKHHELQRRLRSFKQVRIPFAEQIAGHIPCKPIEVRRGLPRFLNLISSVALLHQRQRQVDDGVLVATMDDYYIARSLYLEPMKSLLLGGLPKATVSAFDNLRSKFSPGNSFSQDMAAKTLEKDRSSASRHLTALVGAGLVDLVQESKGRRAARYSLPVDPFDRLLPAQLAQ